MSNFIRKVTINLVVIAESGLIQLLNIVLYLLNIMLY